MNMNNTFGTGISILQTYILLYCIGLFRPDAEGVSQGGPVSEDQAGHQSDPEPLHECSGGHEE